MECIQKLIYFPKSDGIYAKVNIINQYAKTIIILPAIGVEIDKYQKLIRGLNTKGFNTIAADYPGCEKFLVTLIMDIEIYCKILFRNL